MRLSGAYEYRSCNTRLRSVGGCEESRVEYRVVYGVVLHGGMLGLLALTKGRKRKHFVCCKGLGTNGHT